MSFMFSMGLSDQHSVERIFMVLGKGGCAERMAVMDRQRVDPVRGHPVRNVNVWWLRKTQLPGSTLDRDLPGACRGKEDLMARGTEDIQGAPGEALRTHVQPEPDVGIQEDH